MRSKTEEEIQKDGKWHTVRIDNGDLYIDDDFKENISPVYVGMTTYDGIMIKNKPLSKKDLKTIFKP